MNALECASKYDCERYVLLQGADYPLHSNEYIDRFFEEHKNIEFLKAYNITNSKRKTSYMRCCGFHIFDGIDRSKKNIKTLIARGFSLINKLGIKYRKGYFYDCTNNKKYEVYWGWGHFALTRDCVDYIIGVYENNTGLNKYFKHVFPPDETYFQTVVYNSPFAKHAADGGAVDEKTHLDGGSMFNLTYFEYPKMVTVWKEQPPNIDELKNKYLYIRKVDCSYINNLGKNNDF